MDTVIPRRALRALALAFLTLAALAGGACGGGDDAGPSGPPSDPSDPSEPGPDQTPEGPAPVGTVMYAVDLANNFIVFGRGSVETPTAMMKITGLPLLKRVIGLAIRKSDHAVIGVGNDSRVYTIDPLTAEATPVGEPFSPQIASFFDIHFAMSGEPGGERIRLIAAESGGNWSIDINDGTARLDPDARYGAGNELEGHTPALLGIVYPILPDSAKQPGWCANLAYGLDVDEAIIVASCDPATGYWYPVGGTPEPSAAVRPAPSRASAAAMPPKELILKDLRDQLLRCGEFMAGPAGSRSDGEQPPAQDSGPWFPHSPDTEFYAFILHVAELQNRAHAVKLIDGNKWGLYPGAELPDDQFVQSTVEAVDSPYPPSGAGVGVRPNRSRLTGSATTASATASSDALAACRGGK
jgi:hypothetical protein